MAATYSEIHPQNYRWTDVDRKGWMERNMIKPCTVKY